MIIRYLEPRDLDKIKEIYDKFFSGMEFPDFTNRFHCTFVVVDETGIVAVGGLRPLAEAVVLTNGYRSVRTRRDALLELHNALTYSAQKLDYNRIFAFTFDEKYAQHLVERIGFIPIKQSTLLVLELGNGQEERRTSTATDTTTR